MKTHYFQRYYQKENVATANTMLLLQRLYSYSPNKFFELLKEKFLQKDEEDDFELGPTFSLQGKEKDKKSIPDAIIAQAGFKIVVETKMKGKSYDIDQLEDHLDHFKDEKSKTLIFITIAPDNMDVNLKEEFQSKVDKYNEDENSCVKHINTTFGQLTNDLQDILLEAKDYEMRDVLNDYLDYCATNDLISDSWKYLRVKGAGTTIEFNLNNKLYYDKADRLPRPHDYLGLYLDKTVRYIGKICAIITAVETEKGLQFDAEKGALTDDRKKTIEKAIQDSVSYNYDLKSKRHRYFFVEEFFQTEFRKTSLRPLWGARLFNLTELLERKEGVDEQRKKLPSPEKIADLLKEKTWE